ncbi:uncharacterized protein LOC124285202 [Haliotis rubra]|uniref:uncharacterized protein LOC124285202 n=1 Tax=Haliotis rubra TaxID=36100 RepID=UPI001EE526CD|nr:uncharacterized protein LOC124285202 [Haliotis rubra]
MSKNCTISGKRESDLPSVPSGQAESSGMVCTPRIIWHGVYPQDHLAWCVPPGSSGMVCTPRIIWHGVYPQDHLAWCVPPGSSGMVCTPRIIWHGVYPQDHLAWCVPPGSSGMVCTPRIIWHGVYPQLTGPSGHESQGIIDISLEPEDDLDGCWNILYTALCAPLLGVGVLLIYVFT